MSMRLFGNSRRGKRPAEPTAKPRPPVSAEENVIRLRDEEPPEEPKKGGLNGKTRGTLYLAAAFALFVGSVIMCLLLIDRSGDTKTISVPELTTQPTSQTQPTATLPPTEADADVELELPISANGTTVFNILFAVVGEDDMTDTMVLFSVDAARKSLSMLSLPRDTYISGNYSLPKLNRVYAEAGGGARGVMALTEKFRENFGFVPDYYLFADETALAEAVDLCGGISVALSSDMPYLPDDAALSAGIHTLSGEQAVWLFRFDEDYTQVDPTEYAQPQQSFLRSLLAASFGVKTAQELQGDLTALMKLWDTDLSVGNLLYFAQLLKNYGFTDIAFKTFSGEEITVGGVDFYELDPSAARILLNGDFNPLDRDLTEFDLNIRQKTGNSSDGEVTWTGFGTTNKPKPTETDAPDETDAPSDEPNDPDETDAPSDEPTETPTESEPDGADDSNEPPPSAPESSELPQPDGEPQE